MKFIRTKITVEKLSETIVRSKQTSCPNCGHSLSNDHGNDAHRFHQLSSATAVNGLANTQVIEQKENEHE